MSLWVARKIRTETDLSKLSSGQLNAKQRKLMELQALAQSRMAAMQANFAQGIKDAKEVQRDLKWTQERVQ